ncbi:hypothetical protein BGZ46_002210 [Entomortierella lignicola]|nr:hypothetical protein BGZ46_002210 [Entomortierella lignicola]
MLSSPLQTNSPATSAPNTWARHRPSSSSGTFDLNSYSSQDQQKQQQHYFNISSPQQSSPNPDKDNFNQHFDGKSLQIPTSSSLTSTSNLSKNNNSTTNKSHPVTATVSCNTTTTTLTDQPKSLSLVQGLAEGQLKLTDDERKVLFANEIPASEITDLSIGVDSGGMGIIHVAMWRGIKVAIKEASEKVITMEIEIYNRMKNTQGVVQFYGVTYPPGLNKLCIVTKYAENGSLAWYLKDSFHKLNWSDKIMLATQITSSIVELHKEGIFHRDLHGGNILIDEAGNAMLTDFGASIVDERVVQSMDEYAIESRITPEGTSKFISQMIPDVNSSEAMQTAESDGSNNISTTNLSNMDMDNLSPSNNNTPKAPGSKLSEEEKHRYQLIGVMSHIAPERFRNPSYFDAKCDIYSLGVLLWELTSGHSAFAKQQQDVHLAVSILNGKRESCIEGTPKMYENLYVRCWQTDPDLRPSLDEILSTLAEIREGLSDDQLAVTRQRSAVYNSDDDGFEESISLPRPTSDYQITL